MREFATKVDVADREHLVDIVGTGGDASHTFNISTAAMFVAAAAGARVAKHGGRSVSSQIGQRRRARGARRQHHAHARAGRRARSRETGIGFMFAPNHHSAMKHAAPVRKELGVRTIFNILGPLTNPAGAPNQLLGVFHPDLVGIQVRVLQRLGSKHVLVVYGKDGMDEVSLGAATMVGELKDGEVREYEIHPEDFGLRMISNRGLKVDGRARIEGDAAGGARQHRGHAARDRRAQCRRRALRGERGRDRSPRASSGRATPSRRAPRGASSTSSSPQRRSSARAPNEAAAASRSRHPDQRILATKAEEVIAAERARPFAEVEAAARARRGAARISNGALRREDRGGRAGGDRRDQEGEPEPGRVAPTIRSRRHRAHATSGRARPACRC